MIMYIISSKWTVLASKQSNLTTKITRTSDVTITKAFNQIKQSD